MSMRQMARVICLGLSEVMFLVIMVSLFFRKLDLPKSALSEADQKDFEVQGYGFDAAKEDTRASRVVRVGLIQNKIVLPTTAPISEQVLVFTVKFNSVLTIEIPKTVTLATLKFRR